MNILQDRHIKSIMTSNPKSITPDTIMTEVAAIFENESFHHLPVLEEDQKPVGIISRHDFHRLQHHFTRLNVDEAKTQNVRFFGSLLAKDVMTSDLIMLDIDDTISDAVDIFLQNKVHSICICDSGKCVGIVTPYDILKSIVEPALLSKQ